jgi:hypothetical protein
VTRFSFATAVVAVAGTVLVVGACSSVPDIKFSDEGTTSSSGNSGSGGSSGTPTDAQPDVPPNCKPTPEVCEDGIDNDCNGKIDCADDACKPVTECVDPAPAGWTLVSFSDATRPNCANGYDAPIDLEVVDGTGTGNCTCDCAPSAGPACSAGAFSVVIDTTNACGAGGVNLQHNTNCTQLGSNIPIPNPNSFASATAPTGPSACQGTTNVAAGPITFGRTCNLPSTTKFGKGCSTATQQCAPKATGFKVCITKLGQDACPAPYTARKTAGTDAVDTRACNACSCEPKGCSGTVELFEEADCTTDAANEDSTGPIGTACAATADRNFTATRYKTTLAAPVNGCGFTAGGFNNAMQGNIAWTEQRTVCCKP